MASGPQQPLTFTDVFEDGDEEPKQPASVQRIRANSSIMQLKKILGEPASQSAQDVSRCLNW